MILAADRPDLRAEDRLALRDPTSDLYCYLFDSGCTTVKVSVRDILARARRIDIDVQLFHEKGQPVQGWLLLYDPTNVTKSRLRSPSYLCQHVGQIASWMSISRTANGCQPTLRLMRRPTRYVRPDNRVVARGRTASAATQTASPVVDCFQSHADRDVWVFRGAAAGICDAIGSHRSGDAVRKACERRFFTVPVLYLLPGF